MAINTSNMPSINNFLKGFSDGLPGMKDYRHASRLYVDDNFKLAPKAKFHFHVVFETDDNVVVNNAKSLGHEKLELNMLVKSCQLPKFDMRLEEKIQYNKKIYPSTGIAYLPVNVTFHDDHFDTVNAFWKRYYEYHIADSVNLTQARQIVSKDDYYDENRPISRFGKDTPVKRRKPYLRGIEMFVLHKKQFTSYRLVNPVIASWAHDDLDAADGAGVLENTMQIFYETVIYGAGTVTRGNQPRGFATIHYDNEPSPLSVLGRGTESLFGPGGIVGGIGSVINDVRNNNFNLGTVLTGINTYNRAKRYKGKKAAKEELKGIAKEGVLELGKQAGTITNPVGDYSVGSATGAALAGGALIATAKGLVDNENRNNVKVINNSNVDTTIHLSSSESYNLVTANSTIKDEIASHIYYKDIGSRKGLTVAESDVEYTGATDTVKTVYRSKAVTNVRKLVTEGYITINRETNNVLASTEKANL